MKRFAMVLSAAALLMAPVVANAQFKQGDFDLTLSGTGSNDKDFRTVDISADGTLGYFLTDQLEINGRQSLVYADGGSAWSGTSRVGLDFNFDLGTWVPFVGANIGYQYGETVDDSFIAGPEVGIRAFVNSTTFIQLLAAYEFNLNEGFDEGQFLYSLGIGFRF